MELSRTQKIGRWVTTRHVQIFGTLAIISAIAAGLDLRWFLVSVLFLALAYEIRLLPVEKKGNPNRLILLVVITFGLIMEIAIPLIVIQVMAIR